MPSKTMIRKNHVLVYCPGHPYASKWGYVPRARLVKEAEAMEIFPKGTVFHHINGNSLDDIPENIMVFKASADHTKFHRELRALKACGNPNWRKCILCGSYGDPLSDEWYQMPNGNAWHKECKSEYDRKRYERIKRDTSGTFIGVQ